MDNYPDTELLLKYPPGITVVGRPGKGEIVGYSHTVEGFRHLHGVPQHWLRIKWRSGAVGSYPADKLKVVND